MQPKIFLVLGSVGIAITALIHLALVILLDKSEMNFFTFYVVWIAFLAIGLVRKLKEKKETP